MKPRRLMSLVFAAAFALGSPTAGRAWQVSINGSANGEDRAAAVTADRSGDVITAGLAVNRTSGTDFLVVKHSGSDGREVWRATLNGTANGDDRADAVAVDGAGDVLAAGVIRNANGGFGDFAVVKLAGPTGTRVWRTLIGGSANEFGEALAIAVDRTGDVLAAGRVSNIGTGIDFVVVKLSGATGALIWRKDIDGASSNDVALAVAVDHVGDVVASGFSINPGVGADFLVVKLRGASGHEVWRTALNGTGDQADLAVAVAVDRAGDVVAAGTFANGAPEAARPDFTVVKLAAATGGEVWRAVVPSGGARAVSVDDRGDVIAAGTVANPANSSDFLVTKLAAATGAPVWRRVVNDRPGSSGAANAVTVDPTGHVVAAGFIIDRLTYFTVVTLDGASGADVWRTQVTGGAGGFDEAFAVVAYGDGRVAAAGTLQHRHLGDDFFVTALRTQLGGRQLVVQDSAQDPSKRKITVLSQELVMVAGTPGGTADPTLGGGELAVFNPLTRELAVIALPASNWTGLGQPAGAGGYEYSDGVGPCKKVTLKPGEALQATCSGPRLGFTLSEASQRALEIALTTGALRHCLLFGGRIVKDVPAVGNRIGEFQAANAPAPAACLE